MNSYKKRVLNRDNITFMETYEDSGLKDRVRFYLVINLTDGEVLILTFKTEKEREEFIGNVSAAHNKFIEYIEFS